MTPPEDAGIVEAPPLVRRREIFGCSAVLLPFRDDGSVDWDTFEQLVHRTTAAGLVPAVNMDTGYVQLVDATTRRHVLSTTRSVAGDGRFLAGAYVDQGAGATFDHDAHLASATEVASMGGTPVIFPSVGLSGLDDAGWVDAHLSMAADLDRFIAFELGSMFVPWARTYSLQAYAGLLEIPACIGAKHSSLSRAAEWDRLALRDAVRPDFRVLTGNDLAIDMVCYGSDYLLGLSAFAPDAFARRDRHWRDGDRRFYELNDALQHLGAFAFRPPVPAYRHAAATFLQLRGWVASDATPPGALRRDPSDRPVLEDILGRIEGLL